MTLLSADTWQGRIYDGSWRLGAGTTDVLAPATGRRLVTAGLAGAEDIGPIVRTASEAQRAWAAAPPAERAEVLLRAASLWDEHGDEIRSWLIQETGATRRKAAYEVRGAVEECREAAALPTLPNGELLPTDRALLSMARRVPVGVVAVITPFNAPLKLAIRSVAPALALGNAVVLKPDPRTPVSGGVVLARIFELAGLPSGVLSVVPGDARADAALVSDPRVQAVSFTGSTAAGRVIGEQAGGRFLHQHLELGGNSALMVLADTDLERAVGAALHGTFFSQGQVCMASGRHLVHTSLYDDFVELLTRRASALSVGDPAREDVALGPLIDERQRDKVHAIVTDSVAAGARLTTGGRYDGLCYAPTVLAEAGPGTPCYDNEVFGPVASVTSFDNEEKAVELACGSSYGLSLGILTRDIGRGLRLAERIPTGCAHINDQPVNDAANAPMGGMRDSGTPTRFGGPAANIDAYTTTRWITAHTEIPVYEL
ncbi:aldehyde dehydrogenase family protein [Streptomyces sp. MMS24-I2-30]|uniref:aldehyde dehydrogenase family protein n=1 Tax=Streptomyces sp. MMS24-I2-30 TaxID=3351564 RepID=UPI003896ABEE